MTLLDDFFYRNLANFSIDSFTRPSCDGNVGISFAGALLYLYIPMFRIANKDHFYSLQITVGKILIIRHDNVHIRISHRSLHPSIPVADRSGNSDD